jgi:hypothetical protein
MVQGLTLAIAALSAPRSMPSLIATIFLLLAGSAGSLKTTTGHAHKKG